MRIKEDLINKEVLDGGAELIGKVVDGIKFYLKVMMIFKFWLFR